MNISELVKTYEEQKKIFTENVSSLFKVRISEFLKSNPLIKTISWHQYTPYFNDGEACLFCVHDLYFKFDYNALKALVKPYRTPENKKAWDEFIESSHKDTSIYEAHYSGEYPNEYNKIKSALIGSVPELKSAYIAFDEFENEFKSIPNEIFLAMFGDHAEIIADKDKIEVEEYDHD